jgi:hypothetical protein
MREASAGTKKLTPRDTPSLTKRSPPWRLLLPEPGRYAGRLRQRAWCALSCRDPLDRADERMPGLQLVAVQRSRFPIGGASNRAGECCGQSLSGVAGATRGELDLLVDLAGQAPGPIFGPHRVRLLIAALRGSIPSQRWCVSEDLNGSGEQQRRPMRNRHPWRLRKRVRRMPALPDRRVPIGRRGRVPSQGRERYAKSRIFSSRLTRRDTPARRARWDRSRLDAARPARLARDVDLRLPCLRIVPAASLSCCCTLPPRDAA